MHNHANHSKGTPMRKTLTALLTAGLLTGGGVASASVLPGAVHGTRVSTVSTFTTVTVPPGSVIAGTYGETTPVTAPALSTYLAQGYICYGTGTRVIFGRPTATYNCFLAS